MDTRHEAAMTSAPLHTARVAVRAQHQGPGAGGSSSRKHVVLMRSFDLYSFHITWLCCSDCCCAALVGTNPHSDRGVRAGTSTILTPSDDN